jgi:citrate lyase subunit beta/citryl-CoA lyase
VKKASRPTELAHQYEAAHNDESSSMSGARSLLIMPANRERMLEKAGTYGADALVFDLEDSVPVAEKTKARALAREYIGRHKGAALLYARVNALQTGMLEDDLDAIVVKGLDSIRVPKSESAEDIRKVDALLTQFERKRGLAEGIVKICPSLESAKGVWFAYEIASSSPRVHSVMCGTAENGDLQTDLGYTWTAEGLEKLYVRSRVLLAARAAGVEHVLDGAFSNVRDPEALRIDCEASRKLGYRGRSVIHPAQVETVNRVFKPTDEELDYYRRVVEGFDAALALGSAATTVDGKLVDYAMVGMAKRVLAWSEGIGK